MQVVIHNLVAILKIKSLCQNVSGNDGREFRFSGLKLIFRVRLWREPTNNPGLTLVAAEDYVDVVTGTSGIQVLEQITSSIRVLREDQTLSAL